MTARKEKRNRGFTVIEFVIVIAVVSILMAAVVPAFDHILNDSRRNTLSVNVETLNALMRQYEDEEERVSFQAACEMVSTLAADDESLDEDETVVRLSDDLGISKKLSTALFYDSQEAKWVFLRAGNADKLAETLRTDYGDSRYVLPVRTADELVDYADSGMCIGLLDDLDLNGVRALADEDGVMTLVGGFALNGHRLSGTSVIAITAENAVAECVSGSLAGPDSETQVSLRFGAPEGTLTAASLIGGAEEPLPVGEITVRNVQNLQVSGHVSARKLTAEQSGVTLLSDADISGVEAVNVDGESYVQTGNLYYGGEQVAYRSFSGGTLSAAAYEGEGLVYCGPIGFTIGETKLTPSKVRLSAATMEPSEAGHSYDVEDGMIRTLDGSLTYTVGEKGDLTLSAMLLDGDLQPAEGGSAYQIDTLGVRSVISARDAAIVYTTDRTGNLTPYCVCVDGETLSYLTDFDLLSYLRGEVSTLPAGARLFYTGEDGQTLYERKDDGSLVASGYYFVWGKKSVSTSQYHNIVYNLYADGGVWIQNRTTVRHGDAIILPKPLRAGYSFVQWYESEAFDGEGMDFGTRLDNVNGDIELYAKWSVEMTELKLTLNSGKTDSFRIISGGLLFQCMDDDIIFRNQIELEGELHTVYPGRTGKPDAYWFERTTVEGKTVYEVFRGDSGVMVGAAVLPELTRGDGKIIVTAYGQSVDIYLPSPDDNTRDDYSFESWISEYDVYYAVGDLLTINSNGEEAAEENLYTKWTKNKRAGLTLALKLTDGSYANVTNRVYQISNGAYTLYSAQIELKGDTYLLRKDNHGVWTLNDGEDTDGTPRSWPLTNAIPLFGLTEELLLTSGTTMGTVTAHLSADGRSLSATLDSLTYNDSAYEVQNGRLLGGKLSGQISSVSGADTYTYSISSVMNKAADYNLVTLSRAGLRYSVARDTVTMMSNEGTRGKRYAVSNGTRPGASTLRLSEVMFSLNGVHHWMEVSENWSVELPVTYEGQDYTVHFLVADNENSTAYTLEPIAVTLANTTVEPEEGKVTFGEETISLNALLGLPDEGGETGGEGSQTGGEGGETGGEGGETGGEGGETGGEGGQTGGEGGQTGGEGGQTGGEGGQTGGEGGQTGGEGTHTHTYGMFHTDIDGVTVTVYGCTSCKSIVENRTITLSRDITLQAPLYVPEGCTYTLDLNGHNVFANGMDAIYNYGTLTIISNGFVYPELRDEEGNLAFDVTETRGSIVVRNGEGLNAVVNNGTLHIAQCAIAVCDSFGSAVVNRAGVTELSNAVIVSTGLGNCIYNIGGTTTIGTGTVAFSATYGFSALALGGTVNVESGASCYSTVGFPFCIAGFAGETGTLNLQTRTVTDRGDFDDLIEADGGSGEVYWLAGTLKTSDGQLESDISVIAYMEAPMSDVITQMQDYVAYYVRQSENET